MNQSAIKAKFGTLLSVAYTSVVTSYHLIGTLTQPARLIKIVNNTDVDVLISTDGVDNQDYIPASSFALYDLATNRTISGGNLEFPSGTKFYVQGETDATKGFVTVTYIYGSTN